MERASKAAKIVVLVFASLTVPAALASVQDRPSIDKQDDVTPPGLIIAKILPPEQQLEIPESIAKGTPDKKITDRRDPDYVRCRIEPVASSILKTRRVCMTNREWKLAIRLGNTYATEFVADNQPGFFVP